MATIVGETERKYDPGAAGTAALDAVKAMTGAAGVAAVSQHDEQILDAVYYGTADLRLIRAGITLRRRTGGQDAGCARAGNGSHSCAATGPCPSRPATSLMRVVCG